MAEENDHLHVTIRAGHVDVAESIGRIEGFCRSHGARDSLAFKIRLAMEEIATNFLKACDSESDRLEITARRDGAKVTLVLVDTLPRFDPRRDRAPDHIHEAPENRPVGGLGVYLVNKVTDRLSYRRIDDKNHAELEFDFGEDT